MAKQAAVAAPEYDFGNAALAPTQANLTERKASLPTAQWIGSPSHHGGEDAVGFFIAQDHLETNGLDVSKPPAGVVKVTRRFSSQRGGKRDVWGWAPEPGKPWSIYVLRSAFRWSVRDDVEFWQSWSYEDAKARADAIKSKAVSKFRALVCIREIGAYPFVLTAHGMVSSDFREIIGWASKYDYESVAQRLARLATEYSKASGAKLTWGIEAFAMPIVPGEAKTVGRSGAQSDIVPPVLVGPAAGKARDRLTVADASHYFHKEDTHLWGAGGAFEAWLGKDEADPENLMVRWEKLTATGKGAAPAEDTETEEAAAEAGTAGFDSGALADRSIKKPAGPPPPATGDALEAARIKHYQSALNDGFTTREAPADDDWRNFYGALKRAGAIPTQGVAEQFITAFCRDGQVHSRQDVHAAISFLQSGEANALVEQRGWNVPI